jgi:glycine cleavage system aminomethyltransferase T
MTLDDQLRAIRHAAALTPADHVACLRVSGDDGFDALDWLCPIELHLRDGQMRHTLLLDEQGRIIADLYICRADESFYLLVEGMTAVEVTEHIQGQLAGNTRIVVDDLRQTHTLLSLGGPFAWELLAQAVDPEIIGLPYMTFFDMGTWVCFRAGKTGEYGYDLLMPIDEAETTRARLIEVGQEFDLGTLGLEALDQCALENWFFNIRREGRSGASPIELQLQWRLSYTKDYVGSEAIRALRQARPGSRLTCLVADEPVAVGDRVAHDGREVGRIVNAGSSSARGDWVATALIEIGLAHPGLGFTVVSDTGTERSAHSVSPPVLNNRSIYINPQQHSYGTRRELDLPPLAVRSVPRLADQG